MRILRGVLNVRRAIPEHFDEEIGQRRFWELAPPVQKAAVRKAWDKMKREARVTQKRDDDLPFRQIYSKDRFVGRDLFFRGKTLLDLLGRAAEFLAVAVRNVRIGTVQVLQHRA